MSFLLGTQDGFSQFLGSRHPNKNLSRCLVLAHSMCSVSICWTKGFTETNSQGYKASTGLALRMIVEAETEIRAGTHPLLISASQQPREVSAVKRIVNGPIEVTS